jgi:hypothetical protein
LRWIHTVHGPVTPAMSLDASNINFYPSDSQSVARFDIIGCMPELVPSHGLHDHELELGLQHPKCS